MTRIIMEDWLFFLPIVFVLIFIGVTSWRNSQSCFERGGHIGPKSICISADGRVLEWNVTRPTDEPT